MTKPPRTLDDLLTLLPGLRKVRSLNADWLRKLLDRQRHECTWCGQPVGKGRWKWCSDLCVQAFRCRCDVAAQVSLVLTRDRGICQECGRDTKLAERDAREAEKKLRAACGNEWQMTPEARRAYQRDREALYGQYGHARGRWREVDHVVPVIEGGGLLGIDNLRLLCGVCHAAATKQLAGRRRKGA